MTTSITVCLLLKRKSNVLIMHTTMVLVIRRTKLVESRVISAQTIVYRKQLIIQKGEFDLFETKVVRGRAYNTTEKRLLCDKKLCKKIRSGRYKSPLQERVPSPL